MPKSFAKSLVVEADQETAFAMCALAINSSGEYGQISTDRSKRTIRVIVNSSWKSFGEAVVIRVLPSGNNSLIQLESESDLKTTLFDWGKNKDNVTHLINLITEFSNVEYRRKALAPLIVQLITIKETEGLLSLLNLHPELISKDAEVLLDIFLYDRLSHCILPSAARLKRLLQGCRDAGISQAVEKFNLETVNQTRLDRLRDTVYIPPQEYLSISQQIATHMANGDYRQVIILCNQAIHVLDQSGYIIDVDPRIICYSTMAEAFNLFATDGFAGDAIKAYRQAIRLIPLSKNPHEHLKLYYTLGDLLLGIREREESANVEEAIKLYNLALALVDKQASPDEWALTNIRLGGAFTYRIEGDRIQNIEQIIHFYKQGLQVIKVETDPIFWGTIMIWLASAYALQFDAKGMTNCLEAIINNLTVDALYQVEDNSPNYGVKYNLALAYYNRSDEDEAYLNKAIHLLTTSIKDYHARYPRSWAQMMLLLGASYHKSRLGEYKERIEGEIGAYSKLVLMKKDEFAGEWALAVLRLANTCEDYLKQISTELPPQFSESYKIAIEQLSNPKKMHEWVRNITHYINSLVTSHYKSHSLVVIQVCHEVLLIVEYNKLPQAWANIQTNLGFAYLDCYMGGKDPNLESALIAFDRCLRQVSPEQYPEEWSKAFIGFVLAYLRGTDKFQTLKDAFVDYETFIETYIKTGREQAVDFVVALDTIRVRQLKQLIDYLVSEATLRNDRYAQRIFNEHLNAISST